HRLALDRVEVVEKRARVAHGLTEYPPRRPSSRGSATTRADGRSARVTSPRIVDSGGAGFHTVKASAVRPDNNRCMEPVKVVVAGPAGAGKSTLVRTIADMTVRSTDPQGNKFDLGRITIGRDLVLYLYGAPDEPDDNGGWTSMATGMLGSIVVVDGSRPDGPSRACGHAQWFAEQPAPMLVAANRC